MSLHSNFDLVDEENILKSKWNLKNIIWEYVLHLNEKMKKIRWDFAQP